MFILHKAPPQEKYNVFNAYAFLRIRASFGTAGFKVPKYVCTDKRASFCGNPGTRSSPPTVTVSWRNAVIAASSLDGGMVVALVGARVAGVVFETVGAGVPTGPPVVGMPVMFGVGAEVGMGGVVFKVGAGVRGGTDGIGVVPPPPIVGAGVVCPVGAGVVVVTDGDGAGVVGAGETGGGVEGAGVVGAVGTGAGVGSSW